jgi:hypothetical protein
MDNRTKNIIWERQYDDTAHKRRLNRLYKYYFAPVILMAVLTAFYKGAGQGFGVILVFGGIGGLFLLWFWLIGFNQRTNLTISEDGDYLYCGRTKVKIEQITAFSTYILSGGPSMLVPSGSDTTWTKGVSGGCAVFLLSDQEKVRFKWPYIENGDLEKVKLALETVLPNKWCPVENIPES